MTREFNIYPALFVLTPVVQEETIPAKVVACRNENSSSWPQTFWGDCLFNESHTQFVLRFNSDMPACQFENLVDGQNVLAPAKFRGERYAITYIPVLN